MRGRFVAGAVPWLGLVAMLAWLVGCRALDATRSSSDKPPGAMPDLTPTALEYVDSDAFDGLFELSLVNQDPVILVRTGHENADWGPRLNAWIAAWNAGGRGGGGGRPRTTTTVRGQAPRIVLDGEGVREFRYLVEGLLGRIEEAAQTGSAWYRDQRERSRRVGLLKPYNLRFHKGEGTIELIFFHEQYSAYYPRFVQKLTGSETLPKGEWSRTLECSECKAESGRRGGGAVLTNRARSE